MVVVATRVKAGWTICQLEVYMPESDRPSAEALRRYRFWKRWGTWEKGLGESPMAWHQFVLPFEMCDVCGQRESWMVIRELVGYSTRYLVCEDCYTDLWSRARLAKCRIEELLDGMAEHGHLGSV